MIVERKDLYNIILNNFKLEKMPFIGFSKERYYLPNTLEIAKINTFYKNKFINYFDVRTTKSWNCRSYAESYKVMANLYHTKFITSEAGSIAIGNVYLSDSRSGHVLNMVYISDDNNIKYNFLDTLGNFQKLNREEIKNIKIIIF